MKNLLTVITLVLLVATSAAQAMDADTYLRFKKLAIGQGEPARTSHFGLKAYEQGLAEAFWLMAMAGSNKIVFSNEIRVCVSSPDVLTAEIVSSAISRMVGSPTDPKELPPDLRSLPLAALAFSGLAQIFPCTSRD